MTAPLPLNPLIASKNLSDIPVPATALVNLGALPASGVTAVTGTAAAGKVIIASSGAAAAWGTLTAAQVTNAADKSSATTQAFTAAVTCAGLGSSSYVSGTYAAATGFYTAVNTATAWVGGTSGAAPASGTGAVGYWVIDNTGQLWVCTAAGAPGTWVAAGSIAPGPTVTTPTTPSTGVAFTPSAVRDVTVVTEFNSGAAYAVTITIGPSTGAENTMVNAATNLTGEQSVFRQRVPKGWKMVLTWTNVSIKQIVIENF